MKKKTMKVGFLSLVMMAAMGGSQLALAATNGSNQATEQVLTGVVIMMSAAVPKRMEWCDSCWNSVGIKEWVNTVQPGDGTSRSAATAMLSLNAGYGNVFVNMSVNLDSVVTR